ncbi:MAG: hypothetical protein FWB91_02840 [Defluviitaleaceae bacterium]|nr:hypothetical protein [Defluviitaleaceae bacterium]
MTKLEEYFYGKYISSHADVNSVVVVGIEASSAYSRIRELFQCSKEYCEVVEAIQAHQDEKQFRFYIQGHKEGMRFLMGMVTQQ